MRSSRGRAPLAAVACAAPRGGRAALVLCAQPSGRSCGLCDRRVRPQGVRTTARGDSPNEEARPAPAFADGDERARRVRCAWRMPQRACVIRTPSACAGVARTHARMHACMQRRLSTCTVCCEGPTPLERRARTPRANPYLPSGRVGSRVGCGADAVGSFAVLCVACLLRACPVSRAAQQALSGAVVRAR